MKQVQKIVLFFVNKYNKLKIKYKKDPKKFIVFVSSFLLVLSLVISSSYAALTYLSKTNNNTLIEAGTLALEIKNEKNWITLDKAIPQENNEALSNNKEYEFTIENTGSIPSDYTITLDNTCTLSRTYTINNDEIIPNEYIKVGLKEGDNEYQVLSYNTEDNKYILEIGKGMKYDKDKMKSEVEKYGIYSYSDFDKYITYDQFIAFNGAYLKILVGKGLITYEQILEAISAYGEIIESTK